MRSAGIARATKSVLAVVAAMITCFGVGASPASAAIGHAFDFDFSLAGQGSRLEEPEAITIDRAANRVFVADAAAGVIDVYSTAGTFVTRIGDGELYAVGIAVDEASGLVYVAKPEANSIAVFKAEGSGEFSQVDEWFGSRLPEGEFGAVTGVAVDNSHDASAGDVYVLDGEDPETGDGAVYVYGPNTASPDEAGEGELLRVLSKGSMEEPNGVTVDPETGRVFVADSEKGTVYEYSAAGTLEAKLTGSSSPLGKFDPREEEEGNVTAVAVDPTSGDLLVAEAERRLIGEFDQSGDWMGWIDETPSGALGEPLGVAVSASGEVYVTDAYRALVDAFAPGQTVPDATTGKAAQVTRTSATLAGSVNGDGKTASYALEWGLSEALGSKTNVMSAGTGEEAVSVELDELDPSTTYYYRLTASNENGSNHGVIRAFTTPTAVEGLATGPVKNIAPAGATLTGTLAPKGLDAHYYFEYGQAASYGFAQPTPPGSDAGEGNASVAVETTLTGLTPNTTYHYRLVAANSLGRTDGLDRSFTTSGPPRISYEQPSGVSHYGATLNAVIDPDELATTYRFEYGTSASYGSEVPVEGGSIAEGEKPEAVSVSLTGLRIGTTYHYRVVATNAAGTTVGPDQTVTTVPPALIDSAYSTDVEDTQATLLAQIDPLGNATTYYIQYGTAPCQLDPEECVDVPTAPVSVGEDEADHLVSQTITGLEPDTVYHYRVIATNVLGVNEGAEHTFTTRPASGSSGLPDDRAWEMVSPPDKKGAPVEALTREGGLILASEDGDELTYVVDGALGEEVNGNRSPEWQQVLAIRGQTEWESHDIATPSSKAKGVTAGQAPEYQYFTPDLSTALVEPAGEGAYPPLAPGVDQATMYLRDNASGTYLPLVTEADVAPGTQFGGHVEFMGASPDLSHVVIKSEVALTGPTSAPGLYEWSQGALQLVSVLPNGAPARGVLALGAQYFQANAVSSDGSRVLWTVAEEQGIGQKGHLYMRDTATGETLQLDAAQGVPEPAGTGAARFQAATSDDTRVFFTDKQRLTSDSTAEPGTERADLYECEIVEEEGRPRCRLTDLTVDANAGENANVQGMTLGTSGDGTEIYVVATGVLADNESSNGEKAIQGGDNLYELSNDGSGVVHTFVAELSGLDSPEWEGNRLYDAAFITARVSPNGRYFAFMSAADLTGYDNTDVASGAPDEEVYLYDSVTRSLRCVSCDATGARPSGTLDTNESGEGLGLLVDRRKVWLGHWLAGSIPGWTAQSLNSALYQSRYLSDSGRLFFDSPDELVSAAKNHKENVYEYEPSGVGSCESSSGGCVSLLSSGDSDRESAFIEATPSGSDVFFVTQARLLPQDTDTAFDIYDARECTQLAPCLTPPAGAAPGCSEVETCRPAAPAQSLPGGGAGTATAVGADSPEPALPPAKREVRAVKKSVHETATRAEKLARALKACRRQHSRSKRKRAVCERHARKLYGPAKSKHETRHSASRRGRGR